jgi:hypothetical protein
MKAKTILLFCLCAICATATCDPEDPPINAQTIHLKGKLDVNAGPNDIEAYFDGNYVYVNFHRDFGAVSITLYDPSDLTIYSDMVNTSVQQLVVIPLTTLSEGVYTLVLESAFGYSDGDFVR